MSLLSKVSSSTGAGRKYQPYVGAVTKTPYSAASVFRFVGSLAFDSDGTHTPQQEDGKAGYRTTTGKKHCNWKPITRFAKLLHPDGDWADLVPTTVSMWLGIGRRHFGGRDGTHTGIAIHLDDRPAILQALVKAGFAKDGTFAKYADNRSDKMAK